MMEENLFVCVEWFPVKHAAARLFARKKCHKKKKEKEERVTTGWTDILSPGSATFFIQKQFFLNIYFFFSYYVVYKPAETVGTSLNKQF